MPSEMQIFRWRGIYVSARSDKEARKLLRERYDASEVRLTPVEVYGGDMSYSSDGGSTWHTVSAAQAARDVWITPQLIEDDS